MTVLRARCTWTTEDGRRCQRELGHSEKKRHQADGVAGKTCTCMLRWHPNRCEAHPENNG
jgi:hypothetical protein